MYVICGKRSVVFAKQQDILLGVIVTEKSIVYFTEKLCAENNRIYYRVSKDYFNVLQTKNWFRPLIGF
jgi:hypothetical protein